MPTKNPAKTSAPSASINDLLAARKLRAETREKPAEAPKAGGNLPPGIENGIAKVTMIKFPVAKSGTYAGKPMLYSQASLIEPKEIELFKPNGDSLGMKKLEGANVQFRSINICDTQSEYGDKTLEENWAACENHLKLLGIPTEDIDDEDFQETVCQYPETEDLFVRFRTWASEPTKEYPNPRTQVVLEGVAEGYVQEIVDDMDDATEEAPPVPKAKAGKPATTTKSPSTKTTPAPKKTTTSPSKAAKVENSDGPDLDVLAAAADDEDSAEAQEELTRIATEAGIDIADLETWTEGAQAIRDALSADTTDDEGDSYDDVEAPEPKATPSKEPAKDDIVMYTPPKSKTPVECEVSRVIKGKRTVNLVELDDDTKEYKNVSWDDIEL